MNDLRYVWIVKYMYMDFLNLFIDKPLFLLTTDYESALE